MPGLVAFGRRWMAATDELVIPFGTVVVFRLAWLLLICIIFGIHAEILQTDPGSTTPEILCKSKVNIYMIGYILLLVIIATMDGLISFSSSRGTVFELHKRTPVVPLLYIRAGLFVIELTWQVLGFVWIFSSSVRNDCHSVPTKTLAQGVLIFNFLFMIGSLVPIYFFFDSAGRLWPKLHSARAKGSAYGAINKEIRMKYERKWEKSCKALFCCSKIESSQENVFGFVSSLLSEYFQEYLDLVPSDIVAGLILLRRHQKFLESKRIACLLDGSSAPDQDCNNKTPEFVIKKGEKFVHRHQKTQSAKAFNYQNLRESKVYEDVLHFSSYALAVYGWPFYIYDRILCGACTLCCKVRCCASCCGPSKNQFTIVEDNCCECNIEATKLFLNEHEHELIYVSYKDEIYQPPFFVAVDHKKRSVVISCRGTLSLKDVLTDVMVEEERIPVETEEANLMGHKGMIEAAQFVLDVITKEGLLERAFNSDPSRGSETYDLTIVGHSLGAGVASMLAFLLRPQHPKLTCFAYSAVGATFNYAASKYSQDFIYSIVVGKDVISRLNLHTLDELRYMIIELLQRTNLPKWKILRGCMCQCMLCCQATSKTSHEDYLDHEFHDIPPYEPPSSKRYYMGGKVIHIVKTHSIYPRWVGKKKALYEAVWADVEDFQSILISNLMWKDHVPDTVKQALSSCWGQAEVPKTNGSAKEADRSKENLNGATKDAKSEEKEHLLGASQEETADEVKIDIANATVITLATEEGTQQSGDTEEEVKSEDHQPCEVLINLKEDADEGTKKGEKRCSGSEVKAEDADPVEIVIKTSESVEIVDVVVQETREEKSCEVHIDVKDETVEGSEKPDHSDTPSKEEGLTAAESTEFLEIELEKGNECPTQIEVQQKLEVDSGKDEEDRKEERNGEEKEGDCGATDRQKELESGEEEGLRKSNSMGFVEIVLVHSGTNQLETETSADETSAGGNEESVNQVKAPEAASIEVASDLSEAPVEATEDFAITVVENVEIVEQIKVEAGSLEESSSAVVSNQELDDQGSTERVEVETVIVVTEAVSEQIPSLNADENVEGEDKDACKEESQDVFQIPESDTVGANDATEPSEEVKVLDGTADVCVSSSVDLEQSAGSLASPVATVIVPSDASIEIVSPVDAISATVEAVSLPEETKLTDAAPSEPASSAEKLLEVVPSEQEMEPNKGESFGPSEPTTNEPVLPAEEIKESVTASDSPVPSLKPAEEQELQESSVPSNGTSTNVTEPSSLDQGLSEKKEPSISEARSADDEISPPKEAESSDLAMSKTEEAQSDEGAQHATEELIEDISVDARAIDVKEEIEVSPNVTWPDDTSAVLNGGSQTGDEAADDSDFVIVKEVSNIETHDSGHHGSVVVTTVTEVVTEIVKVVED